MTPRRPGSAATARHHTAAGSITLPTDWSPEQVFAVFEIPGELREPVWAQLRGLQFQQVRLEQQHTTPFTAADAIDDTAAPF